MRILSATAFATMLSLISLAAPAKAEGLFFSANLERLEHRFSVDNDDDDVVAAKGDFSYGGNSWKLHGLFETEYSSDESAWETVELQGRLSVPVSDFWDAYGGIRHDTRPHPARTYATAGISGLAPYFIETDATLFISEEGDVSTRLEAEKDFLITQRLVFQPAVEIDLALSDDEDIGVGAGLVSTEAGLRLRYEITRDFAPYVGVNYERKWGETKRFASNEGEERDNFSLLAGLKLSY